MPFRAFLSSTLADLIDFRQAAFNTVARVDAELLGFERFSASDATPIGASQAEIRKCDVFIGIVGWRYGGIPERDNPERLSYVEIEFRYAWSLRIPTLIFVLGDETRPHNSDEPDFDRLLAFRQRVLSERFVGMVRSPTDFAESLLRALHEWQQTRNVEHEPHEVVPLPPQVDPFELAWRLVVDRKAAPALLLGMDAKLLWEATLKWKAETLPEGAVAGHAVYELAQNTLREKQGVLSPDPLWLGWMHATRSHLLSKGTTVPVNVPSPNVA